ncbi:helix-turn-helix domain-containing protein [Limosilactobacillus caviae]|jgi:transcriptional regulator with XRE-family HTH domain
MMKNRIKECRKAMGITQSELGNIVGLTNNTISRYELNEREPNLVMWERLARALHVSPSYLVGWSNAK